MPKILKKDTETFNKGFIVAPANLAIKVDKIFNLVEELYLYCSVIGENNILEVILLAVSEEIAAVIFAFK